MPEYKAPGVYVEETGFRPKSIEGVSTGTTAFAGVTRSGPVAVRPPMLLSYADYERIYDNSGDAAYDGADDSRLDILAHSVRAYFNEGGKRLYVARVASSGAAPSLADWQAALGILEMLDDVSIVAAPGHTEFPETAAGVTRELVSHAEKRHLYRVAVLDVPKGKTPAEARDFKATVDSSYAAIYYPWVMTANPVAGQGAKEIMLPPSGFLCGIYARTDSERGVWKAPANEVIHSATGLERMLSQSDQEILNPAGVNCLRFFAGRGYRVWGARTASSDPAWKYVHLRRYFIYLEHSIDRGTQWAVFEPNGERLWASVRGAVGNFLYEEWKRGAILGDTADKAFFVRCDRTTMTQSDIDNGRLVCLIGVAPLKPAEFIIFRIGQKTADSKC